MYQRYILGLLWLLLRCVCQSVGSTLVGNSVGKEELSGILSFFFSLSLLLFLFCFLLLFFVFYFILLTTPLSLYRVCYFFFHTCFSYHFYCCCSLPLSSSFTIYISSHFYFNVYYIGVVASSKGSDSLPNLMLLCKEGGRVEPLSSLVTSRA